MRITDLITADAVGAFYFDDQAALRAGRGLDGFFYEGSPVTPGFHAVRMPADIASIGLVLEDGQIAWGDCATVQYAGAGGRAPLATRGQLQEAIQRELREVLLHRDSTSFRDGCRAVSEASLPRALEYGASQALLAAAALCSKATATEVLCREFGQPLPQSPIPLFAQSGDDRYVNVDKMILKQVGCMPHGLINTREKFGRRGAAFAEYARWVAGRILRHGRADYRPVLHFDLYGMAGVEFDDDIEAIADCLAAVGKELQPFTVQIESPFDLRSRDAQVAGFVALRLALESRGSAVRLVADEWCDTLADVREYARHRGAHMVQIKMPDVGSIADSAEAVLHCRASGLGAYLGGSCAETDLSARHSVHVGLATRPEMLLAKPGMGVDEGLSIVDNEQARTLSAIRARLARPQA